jgi:4-diphosphocytidyl-2-C-methyl-D-erythritol kinase
MHNALQAPAEILCPQIKEIAKRFAEETGVAHQMSGSGSAYFGLYRNRREARRVAARMRVRFPEFVAVAEICP